jgi:hypothetical protein
LSRPELRQGLFLRSPIAARNAVVDGRRLSAKIPRSSHTPQTQPQPQSPNLGVCGPKIWCFSPHRLIFANLREKRPNLRTTRPKIRALWKAGSSRTVRETSATTYVAWKTSLTSPGRASGRFLQLCAMQVATG